MRNFKLFTAALTLFISFISINLNAQFSTSGMIRCPYTIRGEYVGAGVGTISISVSTGLEIPPITLFTGGFFEQPIGILFDQSDPKPVRVTVISSGSSQSGIRLKVNNNIEILPGYTETITFVYSNSSSPLASLGGCRILNDR